MSGLSSVCVRVPLLYQHMITSLNDNRARLVQRCIHFYRNLTRSHAVEDVRRRAKCRLCSFFWVLICRSEPQPSSSPPPLHWAKMSITSDEVNFLVYRYLQESGLSQCRVPNTNIFTLDEKKRIWT